MRPDRILLAPNLPGWEEIDLAARLRSATGTTVVAVTNDVRAGTLAEARLGCRCGLYVNLGIGIATALVMDAGSPRAPHHAIGEIAYIRPPGTLGAGP